MESHEKEPLWRMAERRTKFKYNLAAYILVNIFLVAVWYFTIGKAGGHFWPVWPILGWGLGIALQYVGVYHTDSFFSVEKEYEKLKKENPNQ